MRVNKLLFICIYFIIFLLFCSTNRTMAVSITMMMGRIGAVIGNLLFPVLFSLSCLGPFIMIGSACLGKKSRLGIYFFVSTQIYYDCISRIFETYLKFFQCLRFWFLYYPVRKRATTKQRILLNLFADILCIYMFHFFIVESICKYIFVIICFNNYCYYYFYTRAQYFPSCK